MRQPPRAQSRRPATSDNPINDDDQAMATQYSTSSSNSVPSLPAEIRINPAQFATLTFAEIEAMRRCAGSEWRVYSVLALHANNDGECWPGRQRISALTDLLPDHVSRALGKLEGRGLIQRRTSPAGLTVYTLPLHRTLPKLVAAPAEPLPELVGITDHIPTDQREQAPETPVSEPPAVSLSDLRQVKTAAPDGIPASWIEAGKLLRPDLPVEVIRQSAEVFLDHHRAKGTALTNWLPAWRNWLRRERAPKGPQFAHKPLVQPTAATPYVSVNYGQVAQETAEEAAERFAAQMARYGAVPGEGGAWSRPGVGVPVTPQAPAPVAAADPLPLPRPRPRVTADQVRQIAELAAAGTSPKEVAAALAGRV